MRESVVVRVGVDECGEQLTNICLYLYGSISPEIDFTI